MGGPKVLIDGEDNIESQRHKKDEIQDIKVKENVDKRDEIPDETEIVIQSESSSGSQRKEVLPLDETRNVFGKNLDKGNKEEEENDDFGFSFFKLNAKDEISDVTDIIMEAEDENAFLAIGTKSIQE